MVNGLVLILRQQHMVCRWQVFANKCWYTTALHKMAAAHDQTRRTYEKTGWACTQRCELNVLAGVVQSGSDGRTDILY